MNGRRLYRTLLGLLPRGTRIEAETELLAVFDALHARARAAGSLARARFWMRMLLDLVVAATAERTMARPGPRPGFDGLTADLRFAVRRYAATPGWTLIASATLALGLGATLVGAILLRDVLLRPLAFARADRLVHLLEVSRDGRRWWPSWPNARDWRQQATVFDAVAIIGTPRVEPVILGNQSVRGTVARAGLGMFDTFGIRAGSGRLFTPPDHTPGASAVALVSAPFWRGPLQQRPLDSLSLTLGSTSYAVVGVLPDDLRVLGEAASWTVPADVWIPLEREGEGGLGRRTSHGNYHVVARLRDGVEVDAARAEMSRLSARLVADHKQPTQAQDVLLTPLQEVAIRSAREPIRMLVYAGVAVLLVSCLNLAAALLAQGLSRARELNIRRALGATRARLAGHLVTGAAVLAVPSAVMGIALAAVTVRLLRTRAMDAWPRLDEVTFDAPMIAAAFTLAGLTAVIAGLLPALILSSSARSESLRGRGDIGTARESRVWKSFVTLQIAVTVALLVVTGLLVRSFLAAVDVDLGFDRRQVLVVDVTLPLQSYVDKAARQSYFDRALEVIRQQPAIEDAGLTTVLPTDTTAFTSGTARAGTPRTVMAGFRFVDAGYFRVLRIPRATADVAAFERGGALIDRRLQTLLWKDDPALGDRVTNGFAPSATTVAGIVGTVREWYQRDETIGAIYLHHQQSPTGLAAAHLVLRHRGQADVAASEVRRVLSGLDPLVALRIEPLDVRVGSALSGRRLALFVILSFGAITLLLAAAGVYTLLAFRAARRAREVAIRLALGARPSQVGRQVVGAAVGPWLLGSVIGLAVSVPAARAIRAQLFMVSPADPLVFAAAPAAMLLALLLATVPPARRSASVDPVSMLRQE